jgi:hypothetical protein
VHPKVPSSGESSRQGYLHVSAGFSWTIHAIAYESLKKLADIDFAYTVVEGKAFVRKPEYHPYVTE